MKRVFNWVSFAALLLFAAGCANSDTAPGTGGAGAGDQPAEQQGEPGDTSSEENAAPEGGAAENAGGQDAAIGKPAPDWENLVGTDDQEHSLKDHADAAAVAVIFTCNECPVAKAYEERLVELTDDYKDKGVHVVAINTNNSEAEKLPAMKERAEEKGFNFPYLDDPSQETARAYGATVTPHAFLLDKQRNIVYAGAIDDEMDVSKVEQHYLRDAIDAVLAGEQPKVTTIKAFGCGIAYE